jgi:hypothetical protein
MNDKNSKIIDWDFEIIKIKIENLHSQIKDLQNSRKSLFLIFGTIIIAFWAILGTLVAQLLNNDHKINICTNYSISNCVCGGLPHDELTTVCLSNFSSSVKCNVSIYDPEFSIYQYLLSQNTFNAILFFGCVFTIIIILIWRWTENSFYFEEWKKQNELQKIFDDRIPKIFNLPLWQSPIITRIDRNIAEYSLEKGLLRQGILILLCFIGSIGVIRILPNSLSDLTQHFSSIDWIPYFSYFYCPLPICWLFVISVAVTSCITVGSWRVIEWLWKREV